MATAAKQMIISEGGTVGQTNGPILADSGPKFMKFGDDVWDPSYIQTPFTVVYVMFLAGDIGPQICH